jgi:hypothetical protein
MKFRRVPVISSRMRKVRVIPGPRQDDSRVVVLGAVLASDRVTLHAIVESDRDEIEFDPARDDRWEGFEMDNQWEGFALADDVGTPYTLGLGATQGSAFGAGHREDLHVWHWEVYFEPAVPGTASVLTVSHIDGSVEIKL